jgi:hypothetical protein
MRFTRNRGSVSPVGYPTIVCTTEEAWVELRCHLCGGNTCKNGEMAKGIDGFRRHLLVGHPGYKEMVGKDSKWMIEKCKHVIWPMKDLAAQTVTIEKVPFVLGPVGVLLPQSRNEGSEMLGTMTDRSSRSASVASVPRFGDPNTGNKRSIQEILDEMSDITGPDPPSSIKRPRISAREGPELEEAPITLSDCCPCNITGHACRSLVCTKKKICLVSPMAYLARVTGTDYIN